MSTTTRVTTMLANNGVATTVNGTSTTAVWNRLTGSTAERYLDPQDWLRTVYEVTFPASVASSIKNGSTVTSGSFSGSFIVRHVDAREIGRAHV